MLLGLLHALATCITTVDGRACSQGCLHTSREVHRAAACRRRIMKRSPIYTRAGLPCKPAFWIESRRSGRSRKRRFLTIPVTAFGSLPLLPASPFTLGSFCITVPTRPKGASKSFLNRSFAPQTSHASYPFDLCQLQRSGLPTGPTNTAVTSRIVHI